MNEEYMHINQQRWDEMVGIHEKSAFYDVAGFKAGRNTLAPLEREELGNVAGKSLLHLQCHFGMDTMSWARLGAKVTGVDYSQKAIKLAQSLAKELAIIDFFHEFPFCGWQYFSDMETGEDGWSRLRDEKMRKRVPLMFSLKATKK